MIKQLYFWLNGGASVDSNYQTLLNRADTLGYTRPTSQESAQNTLALSFTSNGIFSSHDVIHIFAINNTNVGPFSNLNWVTPASFTITNGGSAVPSYEAGGYNSGVGTGWLTPNFNPFSQGTKWVSASSVSVSIWIASYQSNNSDYVSDAGSATNRNFLVRSNATTTSSVLHQNPEGTIASTTGAQGTYDLITHSVYGGNVYLFKNGTQIRTNAATLGATTNGLIYYMRSFISGHPTSMVLAGAFIGEGIDLTKHSNIYSSLTTYKTAIGL
jgi:hypothetical protein